MNYFVIEVLFQISFFLRGGAKISEHNILRVLDSRVFSRTILICCHVFYTVSL